MFVKRHALLVAAVVLIARGAVARADYAEERAKKLEQAAKALEQVVIDKVDPAVSQTRDGLKYSKAAELHIKFLTCATGAENDKKDGGLAFGIQCSGFTRVVDPRAGKSVNRTGSDLRHVRVHIAGLFVESEKHPKAKIDMPGLDHGSPFPAAQLARDEIQRILEFFFPDIEIDGVKKLYEKQLAVTNGGEESLRVWVQYRTRVRLADKYDWFWKPGEAGSDRALMRVVEAGQTTAILDDEEQPITAARVRIWAEGESGERWTKNRTDDLWLVETNNKLGGERAYHDEKIALHTHTFTPSNEPRTFAERVIELQNNTPETLTVNLRYRSNRAGQTGWYTQRITIPAGETAQPRGDGGLRVRASRLQFTASSENRRYQRYATEPLYMVDESPAGRLYQAKKIGAYVHVFDPAVDTRQAQIAKAGTPIQEGTTTLAKAERNAKYEVLGQQGDWTQIRFYQDGVAKEGWVSNRNMELVGNDPAELPNVASQVARVRATSANVLLGDHVVAVLAQGQVHEVLARNGNWVRLQIEVEGRPMQGWVDGRNLQIQDP